MILMLGAYVLAFCSLFICCTKEEPTPEPEMDLQVDQNQISGITPKIRNVQGEYHLTGTTLDEEHQIYINLGPVIYNTYTMDPAPLQGDLDPVHAKVNGPIYRLTDSSGFHVSISDQEGLYHGSFYGTLTHQIYGAVSINANFENL